MSLKKKDPSLRVAANDPHLVSLGGGRLSTAVTIHYIPIGDTTIGCSTTCSISLNGSGVRPTHCTIYRSEENEVTIVPEHDARILIDGTKISQETDLTQGAMITIGNSNYLRFNNPAEAQMMRSAMGSNERISMPQIDFTQVPANTTPPQQQQSAPATAAHTNGVSQSFSYSGGSAAASSNDLLHEFNEIEKFYEMTINPTANEIPCSVADKINYNNLAPLDINSFECPKVFTADLVTVNMPAKDVLGQKYANFARNLAENHRNIDKNVNHALRNSQMSNLKASSAASTASASSSSPNPSLNGSAHYVNIPNTNNYIQNASASSEYLTKVNNVHPTVRSSAATTHVAYDRYPKPGTYGGGLQIYPMNGVNTEINNCSTNTLPSSFHHKVSNAAVATTSQRLPANTPHLSTSEHERLEDMLKICTEYADRQCQQQQQPQQNQNQSQPNNSITSSPIVQNRIKTNGSLPRDKKSPFHQHESGGPSGTQLHQVFSNSSGNLVPNQTKPLNNSNPFNSSSSSSSGTSSSGYENVRVVGQNRVEINGQMVAASSKTGYENIGKYVPQSPRTKIRTNCLSPKKHTDYTAFSSAFGGQAHPSQNLHSKSKSKTVAANKNEYEQLIKTFEDKLELEMQAIEESSRYNPGQEPSSLQNSPARRANKNINNLTLNLHTSASLQNSPRLSKKPAPAPRHFSNTISNGCRKPQHHKSSATATAPTTASPTAAFTKGLLEWNDVDKLRALRKECLARMEQLKNDITDLQKQENEALRELDLEKALVSAELNSVGGTVEGYEQQLQLLQNKIHRMEAQRNATRVMEENQQAKLKQSIEMKQDQVKKLKAMLKQKPHNDCLKEELHNVSDSLENDRKTFEDLEFQYLEEESEWQAYREDLHAEETALTGQIAAQRLELQHLEQQEETNQTNGSSDVRELKQNLSKLLNELKRCQEHFKTLDDGISEAISAQLNIANSSEEDDEEEQEEDFNDKSASIAKSPPLESTSSSLIVGGGGGGGGVGGVMSQSLFGSAELLCLKSAPDGGGVMSKSINENMFYNNKIELPSSTPKSKASKLQVVAVTDDAAIDGEPDDLQSERVKFNLSLGSDDFEVNPLEKRVPSQDDIDRICKVTHDAPISTKGASTKIFDSIKEIERNRQLLLAQQGHHVIEHERQKMQDLKKKSHDEARAQYLSMLNCSLDNSSNNNTTSAKALPQETEETIGLHSGNASHPKRCSINAHEKKVEASVVEREKNVNVGNREQPSSQRNNNNNAGYKKNKKRHSQPELESSHQQQQQQDQQRNSRPLSESNSELSCADLLAETNAAAASKSNLELPTAASSIARTSSSSSTSGNRRNSSEQQQQHPSCNDDAAASARRSSINSNETERGERKRQLPKHQRPLTRYLPIFSADLNLRHHIESAGHQIALCPHVFVDAQSCRGYLHKLGATFHGWARRWFVLDRQRNALIYFSDKSERKPRGGAYFSTIDEVYLDHLNASKSGRPHCTFIVKTKKRSYHLQAASDAAARIWIDAIITGAQGNLDY